MLRVQVTLALLLVVGGLISRGPKRCETRKKESNIEAHTPRRAGGDQHQLNSALELARAAVASLASKVGSSSCRHMLDPALADSADDTTPTTQPPAAKPNNTGGVRKIWHCDRDPESFAHDEDRFVKKLFQLGVLTEVPKSVGNSSSNLPVSIPVNMKSLHDGLLRPTQEPPLRKVTAAEVSLISEKAACQADLRSDSSPAEVYFCVVTRNREKLLLEWIQYHRILGAKKFFIFDDASEDGTKEALKPFIDAGIVELLPVPPPPYQFYGQPLPGKQFSVFETCFARAAEIQQTTQKAVWVAAIDSDEFLYLPDGQCVGDWLHRISERAARKDPSGTVPGGVAVGWMIVRNNGHWVDKSRTIFEATEFSRGEHNIHFKSFVRPHLVAPFVNVPPTPHQFDFAHPHYSCFEDGNRVTQILSDPPILHHLSNHGFLLHYPTRSFASILQRHADGRAGGSTRPSDSRTIFDIYKIWRERYRGPGYYRFLQNETGTPFWVTHQLLLRGLGFPNEVTQHSNVGKPHNQQLSSGEKDAVSTDSQLMWDLVFRGRRLESQGADAPSWDDDSNAVAPWIEGFVAAQMSECRRYAEPWDLNLE